VKIHTIAVALLAASMPFGVAAADFRKSVDVQAGGTLTIELDAGSLEIDSHDEKRVEVEVHASGWGSDAISFDLSADGGDARLRSEKRGVLGLFGGGRLRVEVRVPEEYSLRARTNGGSIEIQNLTGSIRAHTSGGRIDLEELRGDVEVHTSGSSIRAEELRGEFRATTSGGSIRVKEVTGAVEVETSGGGLEIHDVEGAVRAKTSGGPVSVRFSNLAEGDLETSGGSIEVELPEDAGVDLDARTSGGRVRIDEDFKLAGSVERDHIAGKLNGGGPPLRLRTSGGNIRIEAN
jgi:DUF4097 and DUF4098 domain-containing protein YvlB